jgi:glycosyltransferase involved in cell wall biosynthesis
MVLEGARGFWRELQWRKRDLRGRALAKRLGKVPHASQPSENLQVICGGGGTSGLSRAYRYEIAKMAPSGCPGASPASVPTFLILGQPKDYHRLLASPPPGLREGYRIGFWVTEFETPRPDWTFAFDIVHEIWTPSTFSAAAIRRATALPVKVVPHAVSVPAVQPLPRSLFGIDPDDFLGMAIMDLSSCPDRKNPLAHIAAWKSAFGNDLRAKLLMKVRFSKHTRFVREELLAEIDGAPNIALTEAVFDDREMAAFQRMADVYLSLHRAEGYGLNIHEMLEIGTPAIATGWSGNMDFMPRYPHAAPIPFELVPYSDCTHHFRGKDLYWAEPDIAAATQALTAAYEQWKAGNSGATRLAA